MQKIIVIPARFASTRFPGKVLADLCGKPMLEHTYERACQSSVDRVLIATDDAHVFEVAKSFGAEVFLSQKVHPSGTSRVAEVALERAFEDDALVLNLQADEPLIPPQNIEQIFQNLIEHPLAQVATLCEPIREMALLNQPSCVKVVRNKAGYALYFSRSKIPYGLSQSPEGYFRHVGLYGFRAKFLKTLECAKLSWLEQQESLEQLTFLYECHAIHVDEAKSPSLPGVDLPADLERTRIWMEEGRG